MAKSKKTFSIKQLQAQLKAVYVSIKQQCRLDLDNNKKQNDKLKVQKKKLAEKLKTTQLKLNAAAEKHHHKPTATSKTRLVAAKKAVKVAEKSLAQVEKAMADLKQHAQTIKFELAGVTAEEKLIAQYRKERKQQLKAETAEKKEKRATANKEKSVAKETEKKSPQRGRPKGKSQKISTVAVSAASDDTLDPPLKEPVDKAENNELQPFAETEAEESREDATSIEADNEDSVVLEAIETNENEAEPAEKAESVAEAVESQ